MSTCKTLFRICHRQTQTHILPFTQCRRESTTRRHKKLLALPEAPSYTPNRTEPTLVFNPPSAAPNVYHTPLKFLPKDDSRRKLYTTALHRSTSTALSHQSSPIASPRNTPTHALTPPPRPTAALPLPVRTPYEKKYHLTDKDIAEMKRLRTQDPWKWTRVKLAEKFGCSQFFVGMCVQARDKARSVEEGHAEKRGRWGRKRREAREDRGRRKQAWGRDA